MNQNITTFVMVKPDATQRGLIGLIIQKLEAAGMRMQEGKLITMDRAICENFYQEHKEKVFFHSLVQYILSAPVFIMALSGENAIEKTREIMGSTNPADAKANTIRALYGESIERNSIHGSDSLKSAKRELALFFNQNWK